MNPVMIFRKFNHYDVSGLSEEQKRAKSKEQRQKSKEQRAKSKE
jgi:hypothetical protein